MRLETAKASASCVALPLVAAVALATTCLVWAAACGSLPPLVGAPTSTPASDAPRYDAAYARDLAAATLGPNPVRRPVQGLCYTTMLRPVVVRAPATPPGSLLRALADAAYTGGGKWRVRWEGGEWEVDEGEGRAIPVGERAADLVAASNLPCPDEAPD